MACKGSTIWTGMTERSCKMARKKRKKPGREEAIHHGGGVGRRAHVKEFVRRAPQRTGIFSMLAQAVV